jgi:hypothetical protein
VKKRHVRTGRLGPCHPENVAFKRVTNCPFLACLLMTEGVAPSQRVESAMLMTLFVLLLVAWLMGVLTASTLGGFIHLLLLLAVAVVLLRIIQGRNPI